MVGRAIDTLFIKGRLGCMKLAIKPHMFSIEKSIKSIAYPLGICKRKKTNVTLFQAHFGQKPNTPLSNISIIPNSTILTIEQILNHYLDADTVPVEDFWDNNSWVSP